MSFDQKIPPALQQLTIEEQILSRLDDLALRTKEVLTIDEAAAYTGLSKSTLYKYSSAGLITHSKPAGKRPIYFKLSDLVEWMTRNPRKSFYRLEREEFNRRAS